MEFRRRDLLNAEARFLSDYCGEDAVRRWRARLPAAERNQLIAISDVVQELYRALVRALRQAAQTVLDAMSDLARPLIRTIAALSAMLTGQSAGSFGLQAP